MYLLQNKRNLLSGLVLLVTFFSAFGQIENRSGKDSTIFISHTVFLPAYTYPSGSENWGVTVADMNKDGKIDVISCSNLDNKINIHLNNGKGEFPQKRSFGGGSYNRNIVAADLNGDGSPDVASVSVKDNKVNWLLNDGSGNLGPRKSLLTGSWPHDLAVGDLTGDGIPDLVTVTVSDSKFNIYSGDGKGNFTEGKSIATGRKPRTIKIADINGDGTPDAVIGCDDNTVNVHFGKGDGTFQPKVALISGAGNWGVAVADFNKDGKPDIAAATYTDNNLCVFINKGATSKGFGNGPAGWNFEKKECLASGDYNFDLVAGDFDMDGDIDLVSSSTRDNQINVHLNDGSGNFSKKNKINSGKWNSAIEAADFDGDKDLDIVTASIKDNNINIHRNITIDPEKEANSTCVYGKIYEKETNKPLSGIVAIVGKDGMSIKSIKTGPDGKYKFCGIPFGNYTITAKVQGFPKFEEKISLPKSLGKEGLEKNIPMEQITSTFVYGKVTDQETGSVLANATIVIKDKNGSEVATLKTDSKGNYKKELPFDTNYQLTASLEGYNEKSGNVSLYPNNYPKGVRKDFKLRKPKPKTTACVRGKVMDEKTKKVLPGATVKIMDQDGNIIKEVKADSEGKYEACDIPFGSYDIAATKKGYMFKLDKFDLNSSHVDTGLEKDMYLKKFEIGMSIVLENIYYDVAKATLRPESVEELERLIQIMNENPTLVIEIGGHTDSDGSDSYNQKLSQARAQSVVDYLIEAEVGTDRMKANGYGETMPIAPNDTKANKQLNRRTEFKVLDF